MGPGRCSAPIAKFLAPSLPDWQQGGPVPWLLERAGRGCRGEGDPSTAAPPLSLSSPRRMVSLSPSSVPGRVPPSLSCLFPQVPLCPGGGDRQGPRQELAPLPATPLWNPAPQGLHAPKGGQGGLKCTEDRIPRHACTRLLQGCELS